MRSDRFLKKSRKYRCARASRYTELTKAAINSQQQALDAMMKKIALIDWSNPHKDFLK
jgi:hypothetical protein